MAVTRKPGVASSGAEGAGTTVEIVAHAHTAAAPAVTWSVLTDHLGMAAWTPARTVTIEHQGDPRSAGVGTIRVVSGWPLRLREQIIAVDEPTRIAYRLLSGLPVRDYVGETVLREAHAGTDIVWKVTVTPRWPGTAFVLRRVVRGLANGLAREAGRVAQAGNRRGPSGP
ncbi:SRPBCC family protein [Actinoplanes sp. NPDC049118]|uniref:SRPBCC family protein n=1 Tax=Actinoplanes sp. NPDC049118 TaxID=3155769 RepID=UPI0034086C83